MLSNAQVRCVICVACLFLATAKLATAAQFLWEGWHKIPSPSTIRYKVFKDKVVALSHLSKPCGPQVDVMGPLSPTKGKIVKRNFGADGLSLVGVIIESQSGERLFVNVDVSESLEKDRVNLADRSWIVQGLQTLLRLGSNIRVETQQCGAGGRVLMLDSVNVMTIAELEAEAAPIDTASQNPLGTKKSASPGGTSVAMYSEAGTLLVPVQVNGVWL